MYQSQYMKFYNFFIKIDTLLQTWFVVDHRVETKWSFCLAQIFVSSPKEISSYFMPCLEFGRVKSL